MIVTKKTETIYEIEFDAKEAQRLQDAETVFEIPVERIIKKCIREAMRGMRTGIMEIVDRINNS
jgi:hypothetical protein